MPRYDAPTQTVKSREQIEAENVTYWTDGGMSYLRQKYMVEAEQARERWAKLDPQGPNGVARRRTIPKCDRPEGNVSQLTKCDTGNGSGGRTRRCRVCGKEFRAIRPDARLCSATCRKR